MVRSLWFLAVALLFASPNAAGGAEILHSTRELFYHVSVLSPCRVECVATFRRTLMGLDEILVLCSWLMVRNSSGSNEFLGDMAMHHLAYWACLFMKPGGTFRQTESLEDFALHERTSLVV